MKLQIIGLPTIDLLTAGNIIVLIYFNVKFFFQTSPFLNGVWYQCLGDQAFTVTGSHGCGGDTQPIWVPALQVSCLGNRWSSPEQGQHHHQHWHTGPEFSHVLHVLFNSSCGGDLSENHVEVLHHQILSLDNYKICGILKVSPLELIDWKYWIM